MEGATRFPVRRPSPGSPIGRVHNKVGELLAKTAEPPLSGRTFRGRIVATYLRGRQIAVDRRPLDLRTGRLVSPTD